MATITIEQLNIQLSKTEAILFTVDEKKRNQLLKEIDKTHILKKKELKEITNRIIDEYNVNISKIDEIKRNFNSAIECQKNINDNQQLLNFVKVYITKAENAKNQAMSREVKKAPSYSQVVNEGKLKELDKEGLIDNKKMEQDIDKISSKANKQADSIKKGFSGYSKTLKSIFKKAKDIAGEMGYYRENTLVNLMYNSDKGYGFFANLEIVAKGLGIDKTENPNDFKKIVKGFNVKSLKSLYARLSSQDPKGVQESFRKIKHASEAVKESQGKIDSLPSIIKDINTGIKSTVKNTQEGLNDLNMGEINNEAQAKLYSKIDSKFSKYTSKSKKIFSDCFSKIQAQIKGFNLDSVTTQRLINLSKIIFSYHLLKMEVNFNSGSGGGDIGDTVIGYIARAIATIFILLIAVAIWCTFWVLLECLFDFFSNRAEENNHKRVAEVFKSMADFSGKVAGGYYGRRRRRARGKSLIVYIWDITKF